MKSKIKIKFVCAQCNGDQLIETVDFHYDPDVNEMVRSLTWQPEMYFCLSCHNTAVPVLKDFTLQGNRNA